MTTKRGFLQRSAVICAVLSLVLAVACGVLLYLLVDDLGYAHPVSASLMASIFFCLCVGVVLAIIGTSDLPSFRFDRDHGGG